MVRTFSAILALVLMPTASFAGAAHASPSAAIATSIRSAADLDHYLKATPADQSPLSLLPPGARKRFLGTLTWGENGLGGFSTGDLQQYLTDVQIVQVLALFDSQSYAAGRQGRANALTAAERNVLETPLERKFDKLYFARDQASRDGTHSPSVPLLYDRLLAAYQKPSTLGKLDDSDVGLLFRAADMAASISHDARHLDDLRLDLATLRRRGLVTTSMVKDVHNELVGARRFADANALAHGYPEAHLAALPVLKVAPDVADGNPTVLVVEPDGKSMLRKAVNMNGPVRIVVVAGCHFSEDAARAIRADPQLDKLFHQHGVWLAGENESLPDVLQWNREFPNQPMNVAWRDKEWSMLDSWAIPTFYVFRNDRLVDQWSGWGSTGLGELRVHLRKNGLLR